MRKIENLINSIPSWKLENYLTFNKAEKLLIFYSFIRTSPGYAIYLIRAQVKVHPYQISFNKSEKLG